MSPEDVARRHEEMLGYELVDYAEVALPLWQLSVEAICIAHRRFSPIQEYVLRSIAADISYDDLGGFLGLEKSIVEGSVTQLIGDRLVRMGEEGGGLVTHCSLTEEGALALKEEGVAVPVEDQLQVFFDGIHRSPTTVAPEQIALPRDAESGRLVELPSIPPNKPTVADLKIAEVQRVLEQQTGGRIEFGRDLISVKRINRHRRLFRQGVGLVFKGLQTRGDLRLKLIIGGVRAEEVERQFAEQGGLSRPGFIRAFSDSYLNANLRKHLGSEVAAALSDEAETRERQRTYSIAKLRMSSIKRKLRMAAEGELPRHEIPSKELIGRVRKELEGAGASLNRPPVRVASVYEQREFFNSALSVSNRSISLSSLGLSELFVNLNFLEKLEQSLKRDLEVVVLVDREAYDRDRSHSVFGRPYISLQRLSDQYRGLKLIVYNEKRYFHLAIDGSIMLVSNRPFLSHAGRIRTFEQYSGYFLRDPKLIKAYLERVRPKE
jgi:hypothetical protein